MTKMKLLWLKNALLSRNIVSNAVGILVIILTLRRAGDLISPEIFRLSAHVNMFFLPLALIIPIAVTVVYERPIRRYLEKQYRNESLSTEATLLARRRLLNEPLFLIVMDFIVWLTAACVYAGVFWLNGTGREFIGEAFFQNVFTGIITVTVAFFVKTF